VGGRRIASRQALEAEGLPAYGSAGRCRRSDPNGRSGLHPVVDVPALALVVCDADEKGGIPDGLGVCPCIGRGREEPGGRCRPPLDDAVKQAHACWGQPDIFAFVEVADEPTLADVVLTAIQGLPGIRTTETHIVAPV
jgi:Lrp/AsnC ligand binding domain